MILHLRYAILIIVYFGIAGITRIQGQDNTACLESDFTVLLEGMNPYSYRVKTELAVSPDGQKLAIGKGETIYIYDTNSLQLQKHFEIDRFELNHEDMERNGSNFGITWSPDNSKFAVVFERYDTPRYLPAGSLQIHDVATGETQARVSINASLLAWSRDGQLIAVGDTEGNILLIDAVQGKIAGELHIDQVFDLAWSSDGSYLIAAGFSEIYVWKHSGEARFDSPAVYTVDIAEPILASHPHLPLVFAGDNFGNMTVINLPEKTVQNITLDMSENNVFDIAWIPDGSAVSLGGLNGLLVWNWETDEYTDFTPHIPVARIAWQPDSEFLFTVDFEGITYQWSYTERCVVRMFNPAM